jgi:superfamily I DNA and/or RNA helicase
LSTSLFERLIHERRECLPTSRKIPEFIILADIPSIMLDTQYRMHPSISSFPTQAFYGGALKDGTVDAFGRPLPRFIPPDTAFLVKNEQGRSANVTFVDHDYPESPQSQSIANYGDAEKVCDVIADLMYNNPVSTNY